jgi:hypothetical protein
LEKSGIAKTGATMIACFKESKAVAAVGVQPNASFLSNVVSGAAIKA